MTRRSRLVRPIGCGSRKPRWRGESSAPAERMRSGEDEKELLCCFAVVCRQLRRLGHHLGHDLTLRYESGRLGLEAAPISEAVEPGAFDHGESDRRQERQALYHEDKREDVDLVDLL